MSIPEWPGLELVSLTCVSSLGTHPEHAAITLGEGPKFNTTYSL